MIRPLTGRGVLLWLGGFFLCIFAVNAYYIFIAVDTFRGEDEQKPYLQGVEYNRTLERRAEQARLGWTADVHAERVAGGHVAVVVDLKGKSGKPETDAELGGELRHPADENRDRTLKLTEVAPGRYRADAGPVQKGYWDVIVNGGAKNAPFETSTRLWVP
ncbi:MAG: FixH family protein [Proteobacteria bacterium]|nr:FixH family protein [Pseudomonadota bacterium]